MPLLLDKCAFWDLSKARFFMNVLAISEVNGGSSAEASPFVVRYVFPCGSAPVLKRYAYIVYSVVSSESFSISI